jgi:predicted O-methyltransferase YrrM
MKLLNEICENPFDRSLMVEALEEFDALYAERPVKENRGGMRSPHLFATWFMAKTLAPETIIESGVWKGQSTWMLEQACPQASIYSLDLNLSKREYLSPTATYYEKDFTEVDWSIADLL